MEGSKESIKIVLLGDSSVGKTSIASYFINGTHIREHNPTIGASFFSKVMQIKDESVEILLWDTAGQEMYRGLAPAYYRSASAAIVVYDITQETSFKSVEYWINELNEHADESIVICICGNKIDFEEERKVSNKDGNDLAESSNTLYAETSAKTGSGIRMMFETVVSKCLDILKSEKRKSKTETINLEKENNGKKCC